MKPEAVDLLRSPNSGSRLEISRISEEEHGEIKTGELRAIESGEVYPIRNFIPRFVPNEAYAASFGEQWNHYRRTQLDRFNGLTLSRERFFNDTGWTPEELDGQRILEAGCGAGRFTQILLDAGAEVYSIDYSTAVDACWANNGPHPSLFLAQGDLYEMPFERGFFDKVFCYGVLQHTPDVKGAFMNLPQFLKAGGGIAVDVYRKTPWTTRWTSKYWYRPVTKRMPRELLRNIVEWYVPRWISIDNFIQRIPVIRHVVPAIIPCWNYTGVPQLTSEQITQWAILDTFDALSPSYDYPQTLSAVRSWFEEAGLAAIDVRYGGNGILGNGCKR